jgi:N-acetylglucosaminyldiphosphoundecaprenol N-acetyl-beta-D-mannosaminyltransferase
MPAEGTHDIGPGTRFRLGPVELVDCTVAEATTTVRDAALSSQSLAVHLCNAYTLSLAARDQQYAAALAQTSLNLVDGTPVTWFFRLRTGATARGPVRGAELMRRTLDQPGLRHYLYGGTSEVLDSLQTALAIDHPTARVVGAEAPPFRPFDDADVQALLADLKRTDANVVWVGLGTPKQDLLLAELARLGGGLGIGVGAAFDFLSGHKAEAPAFLHGTGLEWAHRLLTEPRRLWRRYLWGNVAFLRLAATELIRARTRGPRR